MCYNQNKIFLLFENFSISVDRLSLRKHRFSVSGDTFFPISSYSKAILFFITSFGSRPHKKIYIIHDTSVLSVK